MHLGIDLGTTNSLAALYHDGKVEVVPNALGDRLTPSAVSVQDDGSILVGLAARECLSTRPQATATAFKRWMGTDRQVKLAGKTFRAEELSALVLKSLKHDAEAYLGRRVDEAVITVPAYFNDAQRRATRHAAELAGLKVERLLNEPTAAGIAYGLQERRDHTVFLVFDLGGGTFDVSILEYFEGVVQVRASAGDTRLGGEDFVAVFETLFLQGAGELTAAEREQLRASRALWRPAEQAKRDLSDAEQTVMRYVHGERTLEQTITRQAFEAASQALLDRLRRPIQRALQDARLAPGELGEVILVGGATRMPMIRQSVARLFQRLPLRTINPDETIVHGAALQAALLARHAALDDVVLTDVMPYSLGVVISTDFNGRVLGDQFSPIIERNTPVPVSRVSNYCTRVDNQTRIVLDIRQGESPVGSENLKLGELEIEVPPLPAGQAEVDVRMSYDACGVLVVDVENSEGRKVSSVIRQSGAAMSEQDVAAALVRLEKIKIHPRDQQENAYLMARAKRLYEDALGDTRLYIQQHINAFSLALDSQDEHTIAAARGAFRDGIEQVDTSFKL
jgi:molecular chaperone HscC